MATTATKKKIDESAFIIVRDKINDTIQLVVSPSNFQVGLTSSPADLALNGKLAVSEKAYSINESNKWIVALEDHVTVALVSTSYSTTSTPSSGYVSTILPKNPRVGQLVIIKDFSGTAGTLPIQVYSANGSFIDGSAYQSISTNYGFLYLMWHEKSWACVNKAQFLIAGSNVTITTGSNGDVTISSSAGGGGGGSGDVVGPSSATDNAIVRFDSTTGKLIQNSAVTIDDTTGNITTPGDIAVNGGDITTTAGTATLFNTTATTLNVGGAATTLTLGASTGTATINNATVTLANATTLNVNGVNPTIAGTSTGTLTLFNTNLATVNAFGAATSLTIGNTTSGATYNFGTGTTSATALKTVNLGTGGASSSTTNVNIGSANGGTTTINGAATVSGDLAVNGGDITTTAATFNLVNAATTINLGSTAVARTTNIATGAAAQTVTLGSTTGASSTTINAGSGDIALNVSAGSSIQIAPTAVNQIVEIGNTATASEVNIAAGDEFVGIGGVNISAPMTSRGEVTAGAVELGSLPLVGYPRTVAFFGNSSLNHSINSTTLNGMGNYAIAQLDTGETFINSPWNKGIYLTSSGSTNFLGRIYFNSATSKSEISFNGAETLACNLSVGSVTGSSSTKILGGSGGITLSGSGGSTVITGSSTTYTDAAIGAWEIGSLPATQASFPNAYAFVGHKDLNHSVDGNYALVQSNVGDTFLGAVSGKSIYVKNGTSTLGTISSFFTTLSGSAFATFTGNATSINGNNSLNLYAGSSGITLSGSGGSTVITGSSTTYTDATVGAWEIGSLPATQTSFPNAYAFVGHKDLNHSVDGNYALVQSNVGDTFLGAVSAKGIYFKNGTDIVGTLSNNTVSLTGQTGTATTTTIGNTTGASSTTIRAGTGNIILTGSAASTYRIGGETTTGTITIGRSSATNTIEIGNAITASGKTQTIAIGNSTAAGGTLNINIGASTAGDNTITIGKRGSNQVDVILGGDDIKIGDSTLTSLGFFNTTPVAKVTVSDITNNITAGGTSNTLTNYTSLLTYSSDAVAIRGNFYRIGLKLNEIIDALQAYGLM